MLYSYTNIAVIIIIVPLCNRESLEFEFSDTDSKEEAAL